MLSSTAARDGLSRPSPAVRDAVAIRPSRESGTSPQARIRDECREPCASVILRGLATVEQGDGMHAESRREHRAALAASLRDDGCTWEDIATEFRRRERCSPLLALRWAHGKSQQMTADAYNALLTADPKDKPLDFRRVHRWEQWPQGGSPPPLAALNRLARVYQVRASFLFDGEDHRGLDSAYEARPGGEPIVGELLPARPTVHGAPAQVAPSLVRWSPPVVRPDQLAAFTAGPPGRLHEGLSPSPFVIVLHGRNPMERRAVLAAIASLPGVALLPDQAGGSLLDPDAHEILARATHRPESVGPEILEPLDTLIMGLRHLDDTLGGRYVAEPVAGIVRMLADLLPVARPSVRQPLFSLAASAAQLSGWIAFDGGDDEHARLMYDQASEWAMAADDAALSAYVWSCRANRCWRTGDALGAVSGAEVARRIANGQDKTLRAWVEAKAGRAYALAGNLDEATRALSQAAELLADADAEAAPGWLYHFHEENLVAHRGVAFTDAGRGIQAAELLGDALDRLPPTYFRERGNYLAYQADAFRVAGDIRQACEAGAQAVLIARQTGSGWTEKKVGEIHQVLKEDTADLREARALGELLREDTSA
jgi:tetratricopeptide (TPR) repeat protein